MVSHDEYQGFSFTSLFVPLTTFKAIQWIIIIGLVVYFNGLFNGFVADDLPQIIQNPAVHSIKNISIFFNGSTFFNGGYQIGVYYKPLLNTTFSIIYTLFNNNAFVFHLFQLLLHIANTCLVFVVFSKFFKKSLSFIFSLVFLIHPINSEAVLYVSGLQELLFFFFGIVSICMVDKTEGKSKIFVPILLLLSLLSKETGILFFAITALQVFLYFKKQTIIFIATILPALFAYTLLRVHAVGLQLHSAQYPIASLPLAQRLINIPLIFLFYLQTFIFPFNLAVSYQWAYKLIDLTHFVIPLLLDLMFVVAVIYFGNRISKKINERKKYIFFAGWFFLGVLFHLQIIPLDSTVSERWFYFSIIGLLGMIGVVLETIKVQIPKTITLSFIVILLLFFGLRTYLRSFDWRDEFTLYSHDVKVSDSYSIENGLSSDFFQLGNYSESKVHAERSIAIFPNFLNYNSLGTAYFFQGNYPQAKVAYEKAMKYGNYYVVYDNLALLEVGTSNDYIGTKNFLENSLKKYPYDGVLWSALAILEYNHNEIASAKDAVTKANNFDRTVDTVVLYDTIMNEKTLYYQLTPNLKIFLKPSSS